ncbi:ribonuclease H-like domain-containing protein [Tanacetum coccineum]
MKLIQFLMGLDDVYQPIRSSLLTQPELPDVKDAFVIVCREESHRGLGSTSGVQKPQVSSFVARTVDNNHKGQNRNNNSFNNNNNGTNRTQYNNFNNNNNGTNRTQYDSLSFKNCGMKGHTVGRCFEIIGYPTGFKKNSNGNFRNNNNKGFSNSNNRGGSSNNVEVQTPNVSLPFTNDQIAKLISLIGEKDNSGVQANMAVSKPNVSLPFTNDQIAKLMSLIGEKDNSGVQANMAGANQHIINSTKNMTNVVDISELNITVGHPNRTIAKINHVGNLKLTNNVVLFDVLVIPEYTVSLLSVNKMIKDSKLHVGFNEHDCVIRDLKKRMLPSSVLAGKSPFSMLYGREPSLSHLRFNNKNFFDLSESGHQNISSPNDDGEGPSDDAEEVIVDHQSADTAEERPFNDDVHNASSMDDNLISEGNVPCVQSVPTYDSSNRTYDDNPVCVNTRRSSRVSKLPDKLNDFVLDNKVKYGLNKYANHTKLSADNSFFISNLNKTAEPTCYNEAVKDINWVQAMNNEMEALYLNNTWTLTELPINRKAIGSKWVYKIKYKSDGEVERYKARVVAKGFGEKEWVDYEEIFSPVVKMSILVNLLLPPMPENGILSHKETENDKLLKNITSYQKIVGKLIYLCNTRPDIAYSVHCLSQHMHSPLQSHFEVALRVLRYLKSAPGAGIIYTKYSTSSISAYADSDWAKCKMTRSFAIQIAANPVMHEKTKRFDIHVHLIDKGKSGNGLIKTVKVDSEKQIADILTKALGSMQHMKLWTIAAFSAFLALDIKGSCAARVAITIRNPQIGQLNNVIEKEISPRLLGSEQNLVSKAPNKTPHDVANAFKKRLQLFRKTGVVEPTKPIFVSI